MIAAVAYGGFICKTVVAQVQEPLNAGQHKRVAGSENTVTVSNTDGQPAISLRWVLAVNGRVS